MADTQTTIAKSHIITTPEIVDEARSDSEPRLISSQPITDFLAIENAVNEAAKRINAVWLSFLFLMMYIVISTGKISHKDLFLETPVKLPILGVDVPLRGYFFLVPAFVLAFHFYFSVQLSGLAGQFSEYERKLRETGAAWIERGSLRHRLDNSIFARILGGPEGRLHFLLRAVGWISMGIAPPSLILFIELMYLPQQDSALTYWHRIILVFDTLLVGAYLLPLMLRKNETKTIMPMTLKNSRWLGFVVTGLSMLASVWVGIFVAVFPWETMPFRALTLAWLMPDILPFERPRAWFSNRLILLDQNLIEGFDLTKVETTRALRNRNFVAGIFYRSDLRQVDFTGSDLSGASLAEAQLGKALLSCAALGDENLECTRLVGANLDRADLRGAALNGAEMFGASLRGAKLDGASLIKTHLEGATLDYAVLNAASLNYAGLDGASLRNASLVAAGLLRARLRGANLTDADLIVVNLDGTLAQNASFEGAQLQGASMRLAHFEGAYFAGVSAYGADVSQSSFDGGRIVNVSVAPLWLRERSGGIYGSANFSFEDEQSGMFGKEGDGRLLGSLERTAEENPDSESPKYFKDYVPIPKLERERLDALFSDPKVVMSSADQIKERLARVAPGQPSANWSRLTSKQAPKEDYRNGLADRLTIIACAAAGGIEVTAGLVRNQTLCSFRERFDLVLKNGHRSDGEICENATALRARPDIWEACRD